MELSSDVICLSDRPSPMTAKPAAASSATEEDADFHCVAIRCVVERVTPARSTCAADAGDKDDTRSPWSVEIINDQVVRLSARCPFVEIVPAVLCQLGYGITDCIGAEGTVHVKNWKPVSCQLISDSPKATVGVILGGTLTSVVTLRIRLHRSLQQQSTEDIKDKMLTYLFDRLQSELSADNSPIERTTLERIISRDFVVNFIPDIFRQTVDQWYDRYFDCRQNTGRSAAEDEVSDNGIDSSANGVRKRPCTDECLDETRLDKWFRDDPNPNDERIVDYVRWLNDDASDVSDRDNRATFDDVATWFADRRRRRIDGSRPATVSGRTSRLSSDSKKSKHIGELAVDCGDNVRSASEMVKENGNDGGLSPLPRRRSPPPIVRRVPVLPNRNAVYVLDAIYPKPETRGDDEVDDKNIIDDDDEREMEIVCDSDVDDTTEKKVDAINGKEKTGERKVNGKEDTIQEEATDLRVHKKACRSDSGASVGSGGDDDRSPRNSPSGSGRSTTTARRSDDDHYTANGSSAGNRTAATGDYFSGGGNTNGSSGSSSSVNGDSPTYPSALHLMPNRLLFPAGPPPPPPPSSHPLTSLYQHHQRALQLAAMSRAAALGLHLSGHPFAPTSPVATAAAAASGRPPSHAGGTVVDDFRNFGSAGSGNGFDGSANGSFSALRTAPGFGIPSDRSTADLVSGLLSKSGCSPLGLSSAVVGGVTSSPIDPNGNNNGTGKRSRVFIDPLTEIPKLERWFSDDTHPSSYIIEKYTEELNRAPYRQRFPRLEPKNLQLWFKNHRAKMKRQREACSAAAAAAAAVVAAAATAATAASPNGERNRNNGNNNGNANGLAIGRQLALPYVNDAISDKHDHPQHQSFGGRGAGNGGSNDGAGADGDSRYDDIDDENSVDSDCSKYGDKRTSDDDEEEEQSDKQYRQVIASGFGCGGGGGGSSSNDLLSVNGNSSCKEMRRDCGSGGGSSYAAGLNSRNGGGSVTGALDALVMRLQSGPFAAHSVSKPEVH